MFSNLSFNNDRIYYLREGFVIMAVKSLLIESMLD